MTHSNPTPVEIREFVERVVGWSQTLQRAADAAVQKALADRASGALSFAQFNRVQQDKNAVLQHSAAMVDSASSALLAIARTELAPLEAAAEELSKASEHLDAVADGLKLSTELVVVGAALAAALATPGVGTIGAATAAVVKLVALARAGSD